MKEGAQASSHVSMRFRLPLMLPSALLPTCCRLQVGAAAAYVEHGVMPWARVAGLVLGAICVIAWLNLRYAVAHDYCSLQQVPVTAQVSSDMLISEIQDPKQRVCVLFPCRQSQPRPQGAILPWE